MKAFTIFFCLMFLLGGCTTTPIATNTSKQVPYLMTLKELGRPDMEIEDYLHFKRILVYDSTIYVFSQSTGKLLDVKEDSQYKLLGTKKE